MKKHFRHLNILTALAVLLGLAVSAWSGAGEEPDPNTPAENQPLIYQESSKEPNAPEEDAPLTAPGASRDPNYPAEDEGPTVPEDVQEPAGRRYGPELPGSAYSWNTYRIVIERNMFSRLRAPRVDRLRVQRQVPVAPPAPDPESFVVLKGIVQEDGAFMAFVEDTQTGQILRVRQGDSVVRGKIKTLTLDSIEYEFGDKVTAVTMGLTLQGGQPGVTFTGMYELTQITSTTPAEGTTTSSSPSSEDEAEILRQLMERRQQQIGQ